MGVWGTGIFSEDTACDVRDRYRDLVGDGLAGQQATDVLLDEFREALDEADSASVIWLALAATQWRCGRLEPRVQARALQAIDTGSDLVRWQEAPRLFRKRQAVLAELRETLLSPQPPEKRIRRRFRNTCEWETGELIGYRLQSENLVIFRVIGYHVDLGGTSPIFELLDWTGRDVPAWETLGSAGIMTGRRGATQFMVGRVSERELPRRRVLRLGLVLKPEQRVTFPHAVTLWRWLDDALASWFGLR